MHFVSICRIDDLREIIDSPIYLSGDELTENMWCIALEESCLQNFTEAAILHFFDLCITAKTHQIRLLSPQMRATFYVWFDKQALQLRLNILSGIVTELPFWCRIKRESSLDTIVDDFLKTVRGVAQHGDYVESVELATPDFDDEQAFILDVYVITLNNR